MAYSSGFNPHPRISYAGAAPTGAASESEYLEIALAEVVTPTEVGAKLAESLPDGLDIVTVEESRGGSLTEALEASHWQLDLAVDADVASAAVTKFLETDEITVERMTKKGLRAFDCRGAVRSMASTPTDRGARIDVLLVHGTPSVRPDDLLSGLREAAGLEPPSGSTLLTRVAQGRLLDDDTIGDPLA